MYSVHVVHESCRSPFLFCSFCVSDFCWLQDRPKIRAFWISLKLFCLFFFVFLTFVVMWWDVLWCGVLWCDVRWCDLICCDDNDEVWCDKVWRKVMWGDEVWCDKVWCDVMRCDVIGCDVGWCNVMWCDVIKCDVVWFEVMWWGVMWWDEVRCDVMSLDVMWYSTVITFFKKLANTFLQVIQVLTYLLFSFCSPSQGLCCSADCTPQNNAFLCLNETECSNSSFCKYPLWICVSLQVMYRDQNISGLLSCKTHLKNYYGSAP